MTIDRQQVSLNCELCGTNTETLEEISHVMERARALCIITGVDFNVLCREKQRQLLLEVAAMLTGR